MKLDNAIRVALEYEAGVHRTYLEAMEKVSDKAAKRVFEVLCEEERSHLAYLRDRLDEWQQTGKIHVKKLGTSIPSRQAIEKSLKDLGKTVKPKPTRQIPELELLKKALDAEEKATDFYKEMVATLDNEGQAMFKRFVEIEEGHQAIVQAEIDSLGHWGFWFDTPEFRLEME
jgi:bacterioferritin (cytochrome b1)